VAVHKSSLNRRNGYILSTNVAIYSTFQFPQHFPLSCLLLYIEKS
jgi:hypothetical protein